MNHVLPYAVGYLLDELKNDITRETPASFEPSIDYVVTKIPRFAFEKFPQGLCRRSPSTLTTQMKSVGEAMAIGRTFKERLQKCLRSLEKLAGRGVHAASPHARQRTQKFSSALAHSHVEAT